MIKSPFHPGKFLRDFLAEHEISQSLLARHIKVQVNVVNQICNEKRGISPAMAIRLSKALGTSVEFWLNLNTAYELGKERDNYKISSLIKAA